MKQKQIVSVDNIGEKVITPYGIGILVDIDGEFEQIRDYRDISLVEVN